MEHLFWQYHIHQIHSKLMRIDGIMNKIRHILPPKTKQFFEYCTLLNLSYCHVIWGRSIQNINESFLSQKKSQNYCKCLVEYTY